MFPYPIKQRTITLVSGRSGFAAGGIHRSARIPGWVRLPNVLISSTSSVQPSRNTSMNTTYFKLVIRKLFTVGLLSLGSLGITTPALAGGHFQTADMTDRSTGQPAPGAVTLHRTPGNVTASIRATDLDPDSAYTTWWVVFNRPHHCNASPCDTIDLRNPLVRASNFYATGFITDSSGNANVTARLRSGSLPVGLEYIDLGTGVRPGLARLNGLRAEIHMVFRSHGPVEPGWTATQIGTGEFGEGVCGACSNQRSVIFLSAR